MLQSVGLQRIGYDLATEQQQFSDVLINTLELLMDVSTERTQSQLDKAPNDQKQEI